MLSTKKKPRSFLCLNIAQFLGALNDNIYKLLTIFLLISALGVSSSNTILSAVGALYVLPFLLFSAAAGVLADRFSKQRIIVFLKAFEILLMSLSLVAFYFKNPWSCYLLLFLLATHSATFGPSKYGIIPEIVERKRIPKANAHITSYTYLAIILGTFLASFLTDSTEKNYVLSVSFCLLFAILGFIASLGIEKTQPRKTEKKFKIFFPKEILQTVLESKQVPLLAPSLFGSAFFLFIGAFTQLNIIPYAIECLKLSAYAGGYLFLLAAIGIAIGSWVAGKLLKQKPELGLSCLSGIMISVLFICLWALSGSVIAVCILLTLIGGFGGLFIISFDAFIQTNAHEQKRGQTIAAANFMSFCGVLVASLSLYLFGSVLGFSPSLGFLTIGLMTLLVSALLFCRVLETALPFLAKLMGPMPFSEEAQNSKFYVAENLSLSLLFKLTKLSIHCQIFIQNSNEMSGKWLLKYAPCVHFFEEEIELKTLMQNSKALLRDNCVGFVFHKEATLLQDLSQEISFLSTSKEQVCFVYKDTAACKAALHFDLFWVDLNQ